MSQILSAEEAVNIVLGGGLKGKIGTLQAQECYYNTDSWSITPYMSDQWGGVAIDVHDLSPAVQFIYGDLHNPYFMCNPGYEFTYEGHEIAGVSVGICGVVDPTQTYGLSGRVWVYGFDENGNQVTQDYINFPLDEWLDPFEEHVDTNLYIDWMAGYNDNNGEWFITPGVGVVYNNGKLGSYTLSTFAGNSFVHACQEWGTDQVPVEDDGVTPTGGEGGGGGYYNRPDEAIGVPTVPTTNIADLGITSLYHITSAQLASLSSFLWSTNFTDQVLKNFASPMENIMSLALIPAIGLSEGNADIIVGNIATQVPAKRLLTTFYTIDCGIVSVTEFYKGFADYETQLQIYLPFIGIREIPIDDCMNGYIGVKYNVDVFSGSVVAFVYTKVGGAEHVVQVHNGNMSCQIPLSGANYSQVFTSLVGGLAAAASKNVVGVANAAMNMKPEYQRSGNIGSFAGLMSIRYPFLIFTTPQIFTPEGWKANKGYLSNLSGKLNTFSNYLKCDPESLDLKGLLCTDEERTMIYEALTSGIYI